MLAKEVIKRVREIQVRTGRQVADVLAGQYSSVFKGRGIEFDEVRPYVPGDEVRSIDWNVTARTGAPYVKRYIEERQLTLMLMADISASQDFGSSQRSKREAAAELCALLAFSATFNDDKVGLTLFHGDIEQYIPPRKGQKHALRVVREVLTHESRLADSARQNTSGSNRKQWWRTWWQSRSWWQTGRQATNIAAAVEFLLKVTKRKTVCFVVSDFFDQGYLQSLQMAARKHDVIAVLLTDPRELELPSFGMVTLRDPETGRVIECDTSSPGFRQAYAQYAKDRVAKLESMFRRAKIDFIHVDVSDSVVEPLARFFRMRERRRFR
ncbi:MAG: DUF58 domain-containing protein [bacterium]|nr:DUF58 domain-containing protein [bacterium]